MKNLDKWLIPVAFVVFPTIYILPFLLTYLKIPFSPLPLDFSPDIYMYLNFTLLSVDHNGLTQNPWYHVAVPASQLVYLKFGLLNLFTLLNKLIGNLALTLVVWNWFWAAATFLAAYLFFRESAETKNSILILFGITLLFFFQISDIPQYIRGLIHLSMEPSVLLPMQRTFFPQIATPLLFLYLYLLIKAFQNDRAIFWIGLFIIQYVAFVNFPYNTIVMGATTFFVILLSLFSKEKIPWKNLIIFAVAVIAADLIFLMSGAHAGSSEAHRKIIDPNLSRLSEIMGGTNIILLILTTIAFILPEKRKIVKFTVTGVGISLLLLQLSDVIFNPSLQLTHHFAYFVHKIIALVIFYIIVKIFVLVPRYKTAFMYFLSVATGVLVIIGVLIARGQTQGQLRQNMDDYRLCKILEEVRPSGNDLLIAPSLSVNDEATWLPLLFKSEVLFSRNSEFLLPKTPTGNDLYRHKEAIYLFLRGIDTKKLFNILFASDAKNGKIQQIIKVGQRFDLHTSERKTLLKKVYGEISYYISPLEKNPKLLAAAIEKILRDEEFKNQLSSSAKETIKEWTYDKMARGFIDAVKFVTEK